MRAFESRRGHVRTVIRATLADALRGHLAAAGIELPADAAVHLEEPQRRDHGRLDYSR